MFSVKVNGIESAVKSLSNIKKSAVPLTTRFTLNDMAFLARDAALSSMRQKFTLRNRFTERQIRVKKATERSVADMVAKVGHTQAYMARQEDGGVLRAQKRNLMIPTREARIGKSESRLVRSKFRMKNLNLGSNSPFAAKIGARRGIFIRLRSRIRMIYDMSRKTVTIRRRPWLGPGVRDARGRFEDIFMRHAREVIQRFLLQRGKGR